jgi:hypothetical protein
MPDPERLDTVLAAMTFDPQVSPEVFMAEWLAWDDVATRALQLPVGWRAQVAELIAYGLTDDDLGRCVAIARRAPDIVAGRRFRYAIGVGRRIAGERRRAARRPVDTPTDERRVAPLGPFVLTASGRVHRSTCRTLSQACGRRAVGVPSIAPYVPCQVCL